MKEKKYRMKWTSKATGEEHHGPTLIGISKSEMERRRDYFNRYYVNATHEVEEVKESEVK